MLAKKQRLTTRDFSLVMAKGGDVAGPFFAVKYLPGPHLKASPAVSKKVWKTAASRNRARRRIYAALREVFSARRARPGSIVVIARKPFDRLPFRELVRALSDAFVKAGVIA